MLKKLTSRAPFPKSVTVLPWSVQGGNSASSRRQQAAKKKVCEDRMLSVDFASPNHAPSELPFGFRNEAGNVAFDSERRRIVAGLGKEPSVRDYRLAVTNAVRKAQRLQASALLLRSLPDDVHSMGDLFQPPTALAAADIVEKTASFAVTAAYKYERLKSKKGGAKHCDHRHMDLFIDSDATEAIKNGNVIGDCINEARNLGNLREDEGVPQLYFEWIKSELAPLGVKVRHVLKGEQLQKMGLNLLYNVGKGSCHEPYLVVFEYVGNRHSSESTALVGKGVTFDCGGLNVKPYGAMETMHMDMMGAATVMTTLKAIATLRLPVNVVGAVGLAENAIGPNSYHPSTIITSRKGLTVEVLNTDAEGRLVLADTLTYVQRDAKLEKKVHTIIDLATLTGAVLVGLGTRRAGIFSNNLPLSQRLMAGGRRSGDEIWPMPIGEEHLKAVKGGIADLVNVSSGREAGSCNAAAFLSNFVEDNVKWAHLDIAGPAMGGDKPKGFQPAGAPGFGVQLLLDHFRPGLQNGGVGASTAGIGTNTYSDDAVGADTDDDYNSVGVAEAEVWAAADKKKRVQKRSKTSKSKTSKIKVPKSKRKHK